MSPRPIIREFCCLVPLRSGCIIIGCFLLFSATIYMLGYLNHGMPNRNKKADRFLIQEGFIISVIGCVFNYIIGVLILIGSFMRLPKAILASAGVLLLYTAFCLGAAAFAVLEHHPVPCVVLLIYAGLEFYFSITAYSRFAEMKEDDEFWNSLEQPNREEIEMQTPQARELK